MLYFVCKGGGGKLGRVWGSKAQTVVDGIEDGSNIWRALNWKLSLVCCSAGLWFFCDPE